MTRWWEADPVVFGDLIGGLDHFNRNVNGDLAARYESLIRALMRFAKGYVAARAYNTSGDADTVRVFVRDATQWYLAEDFFNGSAFRSLAQMPQLIANEEDLRAARSLAKRLQLSEEEMAGARSAHRALVSATAAYDATANVRTADELGRRLGQVLYVVRCNLDHGEKTPYGIDSAKVARDNDVLSVAIPVIEEVILRTLEHPQKKLAVYGTLRRGQPNHSLIADLGEPAAGSIRGSISTKNGYLLFRGDVQGDEVPVEMYSTDRLTAERWTALDQFEGAAYLRRLVPVKLAATDQHIVSTIYTAR